MPISKLKDLNIKIKIFIISIVLITITVILTIIGILIQNRQTTSNNSDNIATNDSGNIDQEILTTNTTEIAQTQEQGEQSEQSPQVENQQTKPAAQTNENTQPQKWDGVARYSPIPEYYDVKPSLTRVWVEDAGDKFICKWDGQNYTATEARMLKTQEPNAVSIYSGAVSDLKQLDVPKSLMKDTEYVCRVRTSNNQGYSEPLESPKFFSNVGKIEILFHSDFINGIYRDSYNANIIAHGINITDIDVPNFTAQFYIKNVNGDESNGKYITSDGSWVSNQTWIDYIEYYGGISSPLIPIESGTKISLRIVIKHTLSGRVIYDSGERGLTAE